MSTRSLDLVLPDWGRIDTVRRSPLPFALWTVGDQCLLHHWFDHAVNQEIKHVRIFTTDRPAEIRRVVKGSTLWPIQIEVFTLSSTTEAPPSAICAGWLPETTPPPPPEDGWQLIDRIAAIEKIWLDRLSSDQDFPLLSIGFSCRIHPEAVLTPPYFIGDHVFIGPGCEVGPHAVVSRGSVISGANRVVSSHLSPHSYLGPVTALEDCRLESGILFNLRHRARLDNVEPHLLASLIEEKPSVPLRDRLRALSIYLKFRGQAGPTGSFESIHGLTLPGSPDCFLADRIRWLPLVWQGKLALYGVLPRTRSQLDRLTPEWQHILRHATPGVFSYADTQGCHSPDADEEALHAVYQASMDPASLAPTISHFIRNLNLSDLPLHSPA